MGYIERYFVTSGWKGAADAASVVQNMDDLVLTNPSPPSHETVDAECSENDAQETNSTARTDQ